MKSVLKLGALAAALVCAGSVWAGSVSVDASGDTLFVKPLVSSGGVSVRVTGPDGFVAERAFGRGESAALALSDAGRVLDGTYNYEVSVAPSSRGVTWKGRPEKSSRGAAAPVTCSATWMSASAHTSSSFLAACPR